MPISKFAVITAIVVFWALPASAGNDAAYKVYETKGAYEDVLLDVQDAIVDKGLAVDYTGHVGDMLERTADAVGTPSQYKHAIYLTFCSAKLTHAATKADPENIAICPYSVFVYELKADPGTVRVGYRRPVAGTSEAAKKALAAIDALLEGIVKEAIE